MPCLNACPHGLWAECFSRRRVEHEEATEFPGTSLTLHRLRHGCNARLRSSKSWLQSLDCGVAGTGGPDPSGGKKKCRDGVNTASRHPHDKAADFLLFQRRKSEAPPAREDSPGSKNEERTE